MTQQTLLLDPTAEIDPVQRERLPRLDGIEGKTIGLLDISKARGDVFLDEMQRQLEEQGATVKRYAKPTFAKVAPVALQQKIVEECDAVVEALAD